MPAPSGLVKKAPEIPDPLCAPKQALADDASALGGYETDYQRKKRLQKSQPVYIDFPERTEQRSIPKKSYTCPVFHCPTVGRMLNLTDNYKMAHSSYKLAHHKFRDVESLVHTSAGLFLLTLTLTYITFVLYLNISYTLFSLSTSLFCSLY